MFSCLQKGFFDYTIAQVILAFLLVLSYDLLGKTDRNDKYWLKNARESSNVCLRQLNVYNVHIGTELKL